MKEMLSLNSNKDMNKIFIVVDKSSNTNHIISEYVGIDSFGENSHLTHKFNVSYNFSFNIYANYYPINCQSNFYLCLIDLPFDVTCLINQFLYCY